MRLESKTYLRDVEHAAQLAGEFLTGKTFDDYASTPMLRAAVERQCEIPGEALAQLAGTDVATAAQIREYRRIIAFRNILIHGYAEVDHRIVCEVATVKVPALARQNGCQRPASRYFVNFAEGFGNPYSATQRGGRSWDTATRSSG